MTVAHETVYFEVAISPEAFYHQFCLGDIY